jgi:hypothetical protein
MREAADLEEEFMMRFCAVVLSLTVSTFMVVGTVQAQNVPGLGGQLPGGASELIGKALPNVSSAGTNNTAGVLSFCVKNNYLKGNTAASALSSLSGKSGVQSSSAFSAGQQGQLETGNGSMFSLSGLQSQAKSKLCDMVLQHAQSML